METTLKYMARMHQQLIDDYLDADGLYRADCGSIAIEVGKRLQSEGKYPEIRSVCVLDSLVREIDLIPVVFKGKWADGWGCHHICCESGLAYDPLFGEPVLMEDYCELMFEENLPLRLAFTFDNFTRLVNRKRR